MGWSQGSFLGGKKKKNTHVRINANYTVKLINMMMIIFCYDLIIILIMILIQGEYSSIFENILDLYRAHAEYDSGTEYKKKV